MNLAVIQSKPKSLLLIGLFNKAYLPMGGVGSTACGSDRTVNYLAISMPTKALLNEPLCAAVSVRRRAHVAHGGTPEQSDSGSVPAGILRKCAGAPDRPAGTSSARGGVQMAWLTQSMALVRTLRHLSAVLPVASRGARPTDVD